MIPNLCCFSTPRTDDPHAIKLCVSDSDGRRIDNLPHELGREKVIVTDLETGLRYSIRRASCWLRGCNCAVQAKLIGRVRRMKIKSDFLKANKELSS